MAKKLKKSLVTQKNELSEGRADWTILMARSYVRIMDIFTQRYKAFKSSNPNDVDMFGKSNYKAMLEYDISRTSMAVIGKDGKPNTPTVLEFKSAFGRLADVGIVEGRPDDKLSWSKINIIGGVKYDATYDTIHCDMSPMMLDYLCKLSEKFTQFNPFIAMMFNESKYTFRFYEFCCQWRKKGSFDLTIEQIKWRFELDEHKDSRGKTVKEKYKSIRDLKKYVIAPAHDELRKLFDSGNCDICFEYEDIQDKSKPGRPTTTGFKFQVITKSEQKDLPAFLQPQQQKLDLFATDKSGMTVNDKLLRIRQWLQYWHANSADKNWPTRAVNELGKAAVTHPKLIDSAYEFLCEVKARVQNWDSPKHIKNPAAYTKKAWKEKFGIDVPPKQK
jgi:hypothetical protein